jgi:hypothetical protein
MPELGFAQRQLDLSALKETCQYDKNYHPFKQNQARLIRRKTSHTQEPNVLARYKTRRQLSGC